MRNIIYTATLSFMTLLSFGQVTFQKSIGGDTTDIGYSVQQTDDGGYIIAGGTLNFGSGGSDVYLIKTDVNGTILWTKAYGGTGDDISYAVKQTSDGGFIIVGSTNSFGAGSIDVYLIKTNANGDTLWTKTYGGTSDDEGKSVFQTVDGGYIVTGYTMSFGVGFDDVYLIKTDAGGNILWTKTYGGTNAERGNYIQQTADSGLIIVGFTNSFGAGWDDIYVIKTDSVGDTLWTRTFGGTNWEEGTSVQQTSNGDYIIAGWTTSFGAGSNDIYLIKTDANGDTLWTKTYGGAYNDVGKSIQQTSDGNFVITGWSQSFPGPDWDVYLIKIIGNGDTLWTKSYGGVGNDNGYSVRQTNDGGYIMTGWGTSFSSGKYNIYLIKTDSIGNSGCNEYSTSTVLASSNTQISGGGSVGSGAIGGNSATIVSNTTTIDSLLCASCYVNASFTYSSTIICVGETVNFSNTSIGGNSYIWEEDGIPFSNNSNVSRTFALSGIFTISLIADNVNCGDSASVIIIVNSLPTVDFIGLDSTYCFNDPSVTLTGTPPGGTFSGSGISGNQFNPSNSGTGNHTITYSFTDGNGCTDSISKNITVNNCTWIADPDFLNNFKIYPNPTFSILMVELKLKEKQTIQIRIIDILGQETIKLTAIINNFNDKIQIDLSEYLNGIYILELQNKNEVINRKIVKN